MSREPQPWTRVRRGERRDYQILRIGEDVFADPRNGEERGRVIIEADDWAHIVALTPSEHVVLVKQFRFGEQAVGLELPGGVVDAGEDPAAAVERELEEETGYRARRLVPLAMFNPNPAHFTNRVHAFVGIGCEPMHGGRPDHSEDLVVELVAKADLKRVVRDGRIRHALHLATLHVATLEGYL